MATRGGRARAKNDPPRSPLSPLPVSACPRLVLHLSVHSILEVPMRLMPHVLRLAQGAVLLTSCHAAHAQAPPGGLGTATIDGSLAAGGWGGAATADVSLRNADGAIVTAATLYLMNDADNLYLALKVAAAAAPTSTWLVLCDKDRDGVGESGDDLIGVEAGAFVDRILQQSIAGGFPP